MIKVQQPDIIILFDTCDDKQHMKCLNIARIWKHENINNFGSQILIICISIFQTLHANRPESISAKKRTVKSSSIKIIVRVKIFSLDIYLEY